MGIKSAKDSFWFALPFPAQGAFAGHLQVSQTGQVGPGIRITVQSDSNSAA